MEVIKFKAHIDHNGVLTVQMPSGVADVNVDVVLVYVVESATGVNEPIERPSD